MSFLLVSFFLLTFLTSSLVTVSYTILFYRVSETFSESASVLDIYGCCIRIPWLLYILSPSYMDAIV
jgi:hypothetical protein